MFEGLSLLFRTGGQAHDQVRYEGASRGARFGCDMVEIVNLGVREASVEVIKAQPFNRVVQLHRVEPGLIDPSLTPWSSTSWTVLSSVPVRRCTIPGFLSYSARKRSS